MIEIIGLDQVIPPELLGGLDSKAIEQIMRDLAEVARGQWLKLAGDHLSSTRRDYTNGIQPVEMRPGMAVVALVGDFPNYIENGGPRRDMREFLLGPNVPIATAGSAGKRISKEGYAYRAIPFRHTPPGGSGKTGQVMGSAYSGHSAVADAKKMGKDVYNAAKKLKPTTSDPYKGVTYGERLKVSAPLLKPHHKTNIYQGMIRQEKTYKSATQSQYTTFRTISENPDTTGWIRPPRQGVHLAGKVSAYVAKMAPMAFEAYVKGLSGG